VYRAILVDDLVYFVVFFEYCHVDGFGAVPAFCVEVVEGFVYYGLFGFGV
jgi:hypothetical protein